MGPMETHNDWHSLCPSLPFSICANILIVLLALILSPVLLALGPVGTAIYWWIGVLILQRPWKCLGRLSPENCATKFDKVTWLVFAILILLPLFMALGFVAGALLLALGIVPVIVLGFAYMIRVIYRISSA